MPWDMWCCLVFVLLFMVTLLLTVILTVVYILRYKVTDSFYSIRAATLKKKQHNAKQPLCQLDSQLKRSSINISEPWKLAHKQTLWIGGSSMRHISHYWLSWLKKYLCIPATSAPSEQAFSTSGNTVICQRSALKPERVDQLVFLALNL